MEKINFRNINEYKEKDFALYNQLMINKALEEGHIDFLPNKRILNKSIGEWIELKYRQFHNAEFDRYYRKGWLDDYDHLVDIEPKITKKESLLYMRELILKTIENKNIDNIENILKQEQLEEYIMIALFEQDRKLSRKVKIL